jgi:hypothetical protein
MNDLEHGRDQLPVSGEAASGPARAIWMARAVEESGLPDDCVLHRLRTTAAPKLADLGPSEETVKAITGDVTSRMIAKNVKGASQRTLAKRAKRRWERNTK